MMAQHEATAAQSSAASVHPSATGLTHRAAGSPSYLPEPVTVETHAAGEEERKVQDKVTKGGACCGTANVPKGETCESDGSSRFICHICLNSPEKPVVTVCGHLHWCAPFRTLLARAVARCYPLGGAERLVVLRVRTVDRVGARF
jgi:hypothetical protein